MKWIGCVAILLLAGFSVSAGAVSQIRIYREAIGGAGPVRLGQIAGIVSADADEKKLLEELIVMRLSAGMLNASLGVAEIERALSRAGIQPGRLDIFGAKQCALRVVEVKEAAEPEISKWESSVEIERPIVKPALVEDPVGPIEVGLPDGVFTLADELSRQVARMSGFDADRLKIDWSCEREPLVLKEVSSPGRYKVLPRTPVSLGRVIFDVIERGVGTEKSVSTLRGKGMYRIEGRVYYLCESVVAVRSLLAGESIGPEDVAMKLRRVESLRDVGIEKKEMVVGQEVIRAVAANVVITPRMIRKIELVRRNDSVDVHYRSGRISVSFRGKAKASGGYGDKISVYDMINKTTVQGWISGAGRVNVFTPGAGHFDSVGTSRMIRLQIQEKGT